MITAVQPTVAYCLFGDTNSSAQLCCQICESTSSQLAISFENSGDNYGKFS